MNPSSPIATRWFGSRDLMNAEICEAQFVMVVLVQLEEATLDQA
jgi:hypothetical protein